MSCKKLFLSIIVLFVLVSFPLINSVEASSEPWSHTYGGPDYDSQVLWFKLVDGGYALAGFTSSYSANNSSFIM